MFLQTVSRKITCKTTIFFCS